MTSTVAPYGTWTSPITAESLVEASVRLSDVTVDGGWVYWNEGRPSEAGRQVIVRCRAEGGDPEDVLPEGFSARSMVHEYGGRCFAVWGDTVVFSNWDDQGLWVLDHGGEPRPLTASSPEPRADRYADPVITRDGRWVICVRERHRPGGEAVNDIAILPIGAPDTTLPPRQLVGGRDFFSSPRLSADGSRLAWISWNHPNMPWDTTELWVADLVAGVVNDEPDLRDPTRIAGGREESVVQPAWSPSAVLHYISDRSGWWNIYDEDGKALLAKDAEFADPDWVFGNSSYAFLPDGRLAAKWSEGGGAHLALIGERGVDEVGVPFSVIEYVAAVAGGGAAAGTRAGDAVAAVTGSPTQPPAVVVVDLSDGGVRVLRRSRRSVPDPADISVPDAIEFPTAGGGTAHALFYPPTNRDYSAPPGERPPLVVTLHGGPTGSAPPVLNLERVQFWTSRGFAVADVDYRGSAGYGRAYRRLLDGAWGVADVEDCAAVVAWLDGEGRVDGRKAVIRGGSAGGFTTLAALAFTDAFAAGASLYGVADLELLARDTHKFEARYLDRLVGPWPSAADEYKKRSPIHHVDSIDRPVILFQGLEDKVVPPEQSELMFRALSDRGVHVEYRAFEGEQHGFRQASTLIEVARAELEFYGRVLGFSPPPA